VQLGKPGVRDLGNRIGHEIIENYYQLASVSILTIIVKTQSRSGK
jgi:hypothetical protein